MNTPRAKTDARVVAVGQVVGLVLLAFFMPWKVIFWTFGMTLGTWVGFTLRGYVDRNGWLFR